MSIRAQWKIFFFNFNFWHTFSFVFFNSKTGLFSCIFWSEDSFLCKFSWLCLHSGFTWWSWAKYIGWPKKYINMLNMWIQCYTSSRNITIGSKKWNRILKKIARSPIFCGCFWPFLVEKQARKLQDAQAVKLTSWKADKLTGWQIHNLTNWKASKLTRW